MKGLVLCLFFTIFSLLSFAQSLPADRLSMYITMENEKQAYSNTIINGNRDNSVASNNFDIGFYRCEWSIDPAVRFISGKITSYFTITQATDNIIFDLSDTLTVDSIKYHNASINFSRIENDGLVLQFPANLNAGHKDSVSIFYKGVPKIKSSYQAFLQFSHAGTPVISTLSEPYGAKEWWPCKNGLTDKADSVNLIITSPSPYRAVTNGVLQNDTTIGSNRTVNYLHRYPIASYLVGVSVTNYQSFIDSVQIGNRIMPVICNYYPESMTNWYWANFYAKKMLLKFSSLFGDYPFANEQYSQTQWNVGGGMEHQTNSFIKDQSAQLISHELGHQWFGDRVTCASWQHIWLNEGFGNYMQFLYVQNYDTSLIKAHLKYYSDLVTSQPDGSVFVTDTTQPSRVFSARLTYAKGGYVLHMLRGILGDSIFFKGLREYLNDPALKNNFAVTSDLERNLEKVSGKNLQSFFQKWIYGEGHANYNCTWSQNINNWAKVTINQTTSSATVSFFEMPVQLEFKNSSRDTIITVDNQQNGQLFWINVGFRADTMILDPNWWILAKNRIVEKIPAQSLVPNDIKVYPNPATDHITISLVNPVSSKLSARLLSSVGQLVYSIQKELNGRDEFIIIPFSQFARGMYILKIYDDKGLLITKKIIK